MSSAVQDVRPPDAGVAGKVLEPARTRTSRRWDREPADVMLGASVLLWFVATLQIDPSAMSDWGMLVVLPVTFWMALGLLGASIVRTLTRPELSTVRLVLHLVVLVFVVHGTVPLVFDEPIYAWVYKHVGVVEFATVNGGVSADVDIFHNWPGFFALAGFLTDVAGAGTPLHLAEWAPVFFNLVACLQLGFVYRFLPVSRRTLWLALFLFVGANWVGQDYFAPQALAFVLAMSVFGLVLAWVRSDQATAPIRWIRERLRRLSRADDSKEPLASPTGSTVVALGVLYGAFFLLTISHQLTPFMVVSGLVLATLAGFVRPRWVIAGLGLVLLGFLVARYRYLSESQDDLFGSLLDPLGNLFGVPDDPFQPRPGRRITSLGAPLLTLGLYGMAVLGGWRRIRRGRRVILLGLLAISPVAIAMVQSYGGEARFRVYLFSLPWLAALAASLVTLRAGRDGRWNAFLWTSVPVTIGLLTMTLFGAHALNHISRHEVQASRHFYATAPAGSILGLVNPNFPLKVSANYDEFVEENPHLLRWGSPFLGDTLIWAHLPRVEAYLEGFAPAPGGGRFLVFNRGQHVLSNDLGLLPAGNFSALESAVRRSDGWSLWYRNPDVRIYERLPSAAPRTRPSAVVPTPVESSRPELAHLAALLAAALSGGFLLVAASRRWRAGLVADDAVWPVAEPRLVRAGAPSTREEHMVHSPQDRSIEEPVPLYEATVAPGEGKPPSEVTVARAEWKSPAEADGPERPGSSVRRDWIAAGIAVAAVGFGLVLLRRRRRTGTTEKRYTLEFHVDTGRSDSGSDRPAGRSAGQGRTIRRAGVSFVTRRDRRRN